ncbi:hypothetical protein Pmani_010504 [Petrolisthes manimaculis]|uniref:Membrane protein BRI3 n=1 Tax=Petrolisthes manimaculis TaxID=1843537 RepID=A0AAE1UH82_9EUCA|nr:hypothetical protein Pmani_010504 [Petrolisthes manimaculis]
MAQYQPYPPQYAPPSAPGYPPPYSKEPNVHHNINIQPVASPYPPPPPPPNYAAAPSVVMVGGNPGMIPMGGSCPACRMGNLSSEFTCCGIFMCILFFPLGLICCFAMKQRRCSHCRANYG